jgi:hypothetical protein
MYLRMHSRVLELLPSQATTAGGRTVVPDPAAGGSIGHHTTTKLHIWSNRPGSTPSRHREARQLLSSAGGREIGRQPAPKTVAMARSEGSVSARFAVRLCGPSGPVVLICDGRLTELCEELVELISSSTSIGLPR